MRKKDNAQASMRRIHLSQQSPLLSVLCLTLYGHIKTAEQGPIIQQYSDWYTGRWWVDCYRFDTAMRGLDGLGLLPVSSSLYQMYNSPPINGQFTNFISSDVAL